MDKNMHNYHYSKAAKVSKNKFSPNICIFSIVLLNIFCFPFQSFAADSINAMDALQKCIASYEKLKDYTALLHRKELLRDGTLKEHSAVIFRFKKPSRYYMKWKDGEIEAIYADGKYNNKMVIHGGLLFKFISIAVKPEAALKYNRHTIIEADIGHILKIFETNYEMARTDKDAAIAFEKEELLDSRSTWRFKAVFPAGKDYYGHVIYINIDKDLHLPLKIIVHGWNMELIEQYYYEDLKIDVGLTEEDFDVTNKKYLFRLGY